MYREESFFNIFEYHLMIVELMIIPENYPVSYKVKFFIKKNIDTDTTLA